MKATRKKWQKYFQCPMSIESFGCTNCKQYFQCFRVCVHFTSSIFHSVCTNVIIIRCCVFCWFLHFQLLKSCVSVLIWDVVLQLVVGHVYNHFTIFFVLKLTTLFFFFSFTCSSRMEYLCFVLFVAIDVHSSVYIVTADRRDLRERKRIG